MIRTYLKSFQMGVVAGMRAAMAPAITSHYLAHHQPPLSKPDRLMRVLGSPTTAGVTKIMAVGELIGDKLPNTPDRIEPAGLIGRGVSGAACGAALAEAEGQAAGVGAVVGGLGAIASSFAFFYLRTGLTRRQGVPDIWLALAEDAAAISLGLLTIRDEAGKS